MSPTSPPRSPSSPSCSTCVAAATILTLSAGAQEGGQKPIEEAPAKLAAIGMTLGVGHFGLMFVALSLGVDASTLSVAIQIEVPFAALCAMLVLGERMGPRQVAVGSDAALALAIGGEILRLGLEDKEYLAEEFTDLTGAGLTLTGGALTLDTENTAGLTNWTYVTDTNGDFIRPSTTVGFISNASSTINAVLNVEDHLSASSTLSVFGTITNETLTAKRPLAASDSLGIIATSTLYTDVGGTGLSSYTAGDLIYATDASTLTRLTLEASSTILTTDGTTPQWLSASWIPENYINASSTISLPECTSGQIVEWNGTIWI